MKRILSMMLCSTAAVALLDVGRAEAEFYPIGDLPGGRFVSVAIGLSGDGRVAAGGSESTDENEVISHQPISWTLTDGIGPLTQNDAPGEAKGMSYDGTCIVGYVQIGQFQEAFRWTPHNGAVRLGMLQGGSSSGANAVSADGSVVVGNSTSDPSPAGEAFMWTEDRGMVGLGDLPGGAYQSNASAVSADGQIVVGWGKTDEGTETILWDLTNGTMTGLGDLPGGEVASLARAISPGGRWIAGDANSDLGQRAFLWEQSSGFQDLGPGIAYAVSADGTLVLGSTTGGQAFIWDPQNGMRNLKEVLESNYGLDLTGWKLERAAAISDDATTIAGEGFNPQGGYEGWAVKFHRTEPSIAIEHDLATGSLIIRWPANLTGHYLESSRDLHSWEKLRSVESGPALYPVPNPSRSPQHFRLRSASR